MVDLSHSGERTCLDAAKHSSVPVSINHTGCRALTDLPRNKTDEELRLVASRGGFVGVYFMPFLNPTGHASAADVVEHLVHAVNVCGEDHVGIGTDGPVTAIDDLDAYRARLAEHVARRQEAGVSAAGERADTFPFVVDLRGVEQFRELIRLLERRGWSATRVEKVMGRNFVAYAERVWRDPAAG
jgi:membrane dipeptidase